MYSCNNTSNNFSKIKRVSVNFLETMSVFDMEDCAEDELTENFLRQKCLPVALAKLKETVKEVAEAYGLPGIDLISFDEEIV